MAKFMLMLSTAEVDNIIREYVREKYNLPAKTPLELQGVYAGQGVTVTTAEEVSPTTKRNIFDELADGV